MSLHASSGPASSRVRGSVHPIVSPSAKTGGGSLEIVIVSYCCRDLLADCLRSIAAHPYTGGPLAVTVVDNASADGTAEMVRERFPQVRIHALPDNVGFSRANNVALRSTSAEFALLLNPDTQIWPGVLDEMAAFMADNPNAGLAGCRLVRLDGSFDHAAKRSIPSVADALQYFCPGAGRGGYVAPLVAEDGVASVGAISGAFMLVRREAMQAVGLLDEGYFMYGEDLDWCARYRQAGWEVLYNGRVTTMHVKGATTQSHRRLRMNIAFHLSMGRFYRHHFAGQRIVLDTLVYAGIGAKLMLSVGMQTLARGIRTRR